MGNKLHGQDILNEGGPLASIFLAAGAALRTVMLHNYHKQHPILPHHVTLGNRFLSFFNVSSYFFLLYRPLSSPLVD